MLSLQNGLFCMRELTKAECAGDAHSGGSRAGGDQEADVRRVSEGRQCIHAHGSRRPDR